MSRSGRWRWEIVNLPGPPRSRDDTRGWATDEESAKYMVEQIWAQWLKDSLLMPQLFRAPVDAYQFLMQFADDDKNINRDAISKIARKLAGQ
jgi:hypothetical protein